MFSNFTHLLQKNEWFCIFVLKQVFIKTAIRIHWLSKNVGIGYYRKTLSNFVLRMRFQFELPTIIHFKCYISISGMLYTKSRRKNYM